MKRNRRTETVCRCGRLAFPHRHAKQCVWWRQDAEDRRSAGYAAAIDEEAYQQAMWDKDRADAIR